MLVFYTFVGSWQMRLTRARTMLKNQDSNQLQDFVKTFVAFLENMNFTEMDRVAAIWDDELTSILDIEKIGHRKRILLSLAGRDGIPHRFGKVKVKFKEKGAFLDTFW